MTSLTLQIDVKVFLCHIQIFAMVEENLEILPSETPQIGLIIVIYCHINTFTTVEENVEILPSETPQIDLIILIYYHTHTFTMLKKILIFYLALLSELAQLYLFIVTFTLSPWLKNIFKIDLLKRSALA